MSDINWSDPKCQVTEHFTVHELTYLPTFQVHHVPSEQEQQNLLALANKMEEIREYIGKAINCHVTIRPICVNAPGTPYHGRNYNALVGGALRSGHIQGKCMDFNFYEIVCDEGRLLLETELERLNIRMEKRPGSNWIHVGIDWEPGMSRYFLP